MRFSIVILSGILVQMTVSGVKKLVWQLDELKTFLK